MGNCVPNLDCFVPSRLNPNDRAQLNERQNAPVRFFITGLGSAGKTTILRQLLLLCKDKWCYRLCDEDWREIVESTETEEDERNEVWISVIRRNVLDSFDVLIKQLRINEVDFPDEQDRQFSKHIRELCDGFTDEYVDIDLKMDLKTFTSSLIRILQTNEIQTVWLKRNTIDVGQKKLADGIERFMNSKKIKEVFSENYVVTDRDKIHCRRPTDGMNVFRIMINKVRIELTDVGGQPAERSKLMDHLATWAHGYSDSYNFLLLVVPISEFNIQHPVYEGTLLDESFEFMKVLLSQPVVRHCGLYIFFNKSDRFKEKLSDPDCRIEMSSYLATYLTDQQMERFEHGKLKNNDVRDAITNQFREEIDRNNRRRRNDYIRHTCALDTHQMEAIFNVIRQEVVNDGRNFFL
ncbi:Guanine nucleotide-binding protein G(k) subunit alpha [Aphelenchoides besseyi]|nr:Guanine nucleotide-binding protein G(k) subunit alpha [Aphelenchoides besseyi]